MIVYGKAFDVLRLKSTVDLDSANDVETNLTEILVFQIKSTKQDFNVNFR